MQPVGNTSRVKFMADPENSVRGGGGGPDNIFLVINKFHRGPYEPPLRGVHTIISK